MFDHLHFAIPQSAASSLKKCPAPMKTLRIIKVMIKLLEDSIGRLLQTLLITTWRIVRWSSVPMITVVQWQNIREKAKRHHIKPLHHGLTEYLRKTYQDSFSSVDFVPTLLNLLDINTTEFRRPSIDFFADLMNEVTFISDENQLRSLDMVEGRWAAAVSQRHKMILSPNQMEPCLPDTTGGPSKLTTFFKLQRYIE